MSGTLIVGVAGGSCSGKTTWIRHCLQIVGTENCSVLAQDSYYIDQSAAFDHDGGAVNFDHPSAIDFPLLRRHLQKIRKSESIRVPNYDFATHKRVGEVEFLPKKLVLLDGMLILTQESIRECLDYSYFIECDESLRQERRVKRDVAERGRTESGVLEQFAVQVAPMHDLFVGPSKKWAKKIIGQNELNEFLSKKEIPAEFSDLIS